LIDLDSSTYDDFHDGGTELIGYFQVKGWFCHFRISDG
jgi:hypothetical protein